MILHSIAFQDSKSMRAPVAWFSSITLHFIEKTIGGTSAIQASLIAFGLHNSSYLLRLHRTIASVGLHSFCGFVSHVWHEAWIAYRARGQLCFIHLHHRQWGGRRRVPCLFIHARTRTDITKQSSLASPSFLFPCADHCICCTLAEGSSTMLGTTTSSAEKLTSELMTLGII